MTRAVAALLIVVAACGDDDLTPPGKPDAGVSACGIVGADSECTGIAGLRRCQGTQVVTESCAPGTVCGSDPTTGVGASCHAPATPCGEVDANQCSGPVLTSCRANMLVSVNCSDAYATCLEDDAARCTTPCLEEDVSSSGRCDGNNLQRCGFADGAYVVETVTCPTGTRCVNSIPETSLPGCLPTSPCTGIGPFGACDGETLLRCVGGRRDATDCGGGTVCAWAGAASGYACVAPGATGTMQVSGTVQFERRELVGNRLGPLVTRPARSVGVVVIADDGGMALASGSTDDAGGYRLRYTAAAAARVHVLAVAANPSAERPARVLRPDGLVHGFASPGFVAAAATTVDLLVSDRSGASPAFSIFDTLVAGADVLRDTFERDPPGVTAVYAKGLGIFTQAAGTTMTVLGAVSDDDGYDDSVLLHELGHIVENAYGRTSNPGGEHVIYQAEDARLAWSEGFATYFSSVVRDDSRYIDTRLLGALVIDAETDHTQASATGGMTQRVSENMVSEILWDLGDSGAGDDDGSVGPHGPVLQVQERVLRAATADRGVLGVDLVDFLDGYLLLGGQTLCTSTRGVVESRAFPYDFAGPVSCP